jgi:hypothetical protein
MFYACTARFDVVGNLEIFLKLKPNLLADILYNYPNFVRTAIQAHKPFNVTVFKKPPCF